MISGRSSTVSTLEYEYNLDVIKTAEKSSPATMRRLALLEHLYDERMFGNQLFSSTEKRTCAKPRINLLSMLKTANYLGSFRVYHANFFLAKLDYIIYR